MTKDNVDKNILSIISMNIFKKITTQAIADPIDEKLNPDEKYNFTSTPVISSSSKSNGNPIYSNERIERSFAEIVERIENGLSYQEDENKKVNSCIKKELAKLQKIYDGLNEIDKKYKELQEINEKCEKEKKRLADLLTKTSSQNVPSVPTIINPAEIPIQTDYRDTKIKELEKNISQYKSKSKDAITNINEKLQTIEDLIGQLSNKEKKDEIIKTVNEILQSISIGSSTVAEQPEVTSGPLYLPIHKPPGTGAGHEPIETVIWTGGNKIKTRKNFNKKKNRFFVKKKKSKKRKTIRRKKNRKLKLNKVSKKKYNIF